MSSPLIPSPVSYGDIPSGASYGLMVIAPRRPSNTIDKQYSAGTWWVSSLDQYTLNAQNQRVYGDGSAWYQAGNVSGVPDWVEISTSAGNIIAINGTTNEITATTSSGTATLSIPSTFIAPGSIASTTTNNAGTTMTAGTGITSTTGNIVATAGQVNAGTSMTATLGDITATNGNFVTGTTAKGISFFNTATILGNAADVTGTAPSGIDWIYKLSDDAGVGLFALKNSSGVQKFSVTSLGQVDSSSSITAATGNITATNGNLVLGTTGNKLQISAATPASDSIGTSAALDGATPSQLVVSTTAVTSASKIFLSYATAGGTQGSLSVGTIVNGTSFQIKSSANGDTSTVNYLIIN